MRALDKLVGCPFFSRLSLHILLLASRFFFFSFFGSKFRKCLMPLILLHPLEVTLKLNVSALKENNPKTLSNSILNPAFFFFAPVFEVASESCLLRLLKTGEKKQELSSHLEKKKRLRPRLFISSPYAGCFIAPCRCVTYGKQWIFQYPVCFARICFGLPFSGLGFSLWLHAKIVAVHFGCSPGWIYGVVSPSEDWWLVWIAVAFCWVFCLWFLHYIFFFHHLNFGDIFWERTGLSQRIPLGVIFLAACYV